MKEVTKEAKTFDGGITPEQVEAMKSKHRKVFRVDIVDGEDTHVGYFKRPDFATIKAITKYQRQMKWKPERCCLIIAGWEAVRSFAMMQSFLWLCRSSSASW